MDRKKDRLYPVTVRFSQPAWEAIREMADEHRISQAELVRMAVSGNLSRYLGDVQIVDKAQGEEIRKAVADLFDATSKVENELHRIGVNYNQEVRMLNIVAKQGNGASEGSRKYPESEIDQVMERYEQAVRQVGDRLCRILG